MARPGFGRAFAIRASWQVRRRRPSLCASYGVVSGQATSGCGGGLSRCNVAAGLVEGVQQGVVGGRSDDRVRGEVVGRLEAANCFRRSRAVYPVGLALEVAKNAEDFLDGPDVGAAGAPGDEDPAGEDLADDVDRGAYGDLFEELLDFPVEQADAAVAHGVTDRGRGVGPVDAVPDL